MTPTGVRTIEGQRTLVIDRRPPLQPTLDRLLSAMYMVTRREDIRPKGASIQCEQLREHRFGVLREGRHVGLDGLVRDLRVEMCRDCGAVCVRDVSIDSMPGLRHGRQGAQRRNHVLGWYSGARRRQREFK